MKRFLKIALWLFILNALFPLWAVSLKEGIELYNKAEYPKSLNIFLKLQKNQPKNLEVLQYLALNYNKLAHQVDYQSPQGLEQFITYAQKAVDYGNKANAVKETALAHSALALAYSYLVEAGESPQKLLEDIRKHSSKALELDKNNTTAMLCLAYIQLRAPTSYGGEPEKAKQLFEQILKLSPNYPAAWLGIAEYYKIKGNLKQAEQEAKKALNSTDPGNKLRAKLFLEKLTAEP